MATYCAKFMQDVSDIAKLLHELTKDVKFTWTSEHNEAFNKVKTMLTSSIVIAYFDQKQNKTERARDESPVSFSAILFQKTHGQND